MTFMNPTSHRNVFTKVRTFLIIGGLIALLVILATGAFPITEVM